jgi:hypothetical protein
MSTNKCQCYLIKQKRQCNNNRIKGDPLYCSVHHDIARRKNCQLVQPQAELPDNELRQVCQDLYERGEYSALNHFIQTSKRVYGLCQGLLDQAKKQMLEPKKMTLFIQHRKNQQILSTTQIIPTTTPQQLDQMIKLVSDYQIVDEVEENMSEDEAYYEDTLIHALVRMNRGDLIKHLVETHPLGQKLLTIGNDQGIPPFLVVMQDFMTEVEINTKKKRLSRSYMDLALQLLDLGTPINLMYPDLSGEDSISDVGREDIKWLTLMDRMVAIDRLLRELNTRYPQNPYYQPFKRVFDKMKKLGARTTK